DGEDGVARVVEEQAIAAIGEEQRQPHVRARPVAELRIPELSGGAEPVNLSPALAQPVEVLLAGERKAGPEAAARSAPRDQLARQPAVRRLAQQPAAARVEECELHGRGGDLDGKIGGDHPDGIAVLDLDVGTGPFPGFNTGWPGDAPVDLPIDSRDARTAE